MKNQAGENLRHRGLIMSRFRIAIPVLLIGLASAWAAPAPFPRPKKQPAVIDLTETTWAGDGIVTTTTYHFEKGGILRYRYNNVTYRNGTWKQTGNKIYWEANDRFCEFQGTFKDGLMTGRVWNVRGDQANLLIRRQR
jgi:hypothetical protein